MLGFWKSLVKKKVFEVKLQWVLKYRVVIKEDVYKICQVDLIDLGNDLWIVKK